MNPPSLRCSQKPGASPLATSEQAEFERTALRLLQRPEVQQARKEARARFLADSVALKPAGRKTLDLVVDECLLNMICGAILNDVSKPRIIWICNPAHSWFGHSIGGARYFMDNPDCPYRTAILDPAGSYEIHGRREGSGQASFSFQLYPDNTYGAVLPGAESARNKLDRPLGGLLGEQMQVAPDGTYIVTLSPEPAQGRVNHIQTHEDACALLIRCALIDWATETPDFLEIRRLDRAPAAVDQSDADLAAQVVERLIRDVPFWLKFNHFFWFDNPPNILPVPYTRGGGFGYQTFGNYQLADDEALLFTIHPQGARYVGVTVYNPWSISCEYIQRSGSLNNAQTRPNADGSYTYAIAAQDPGLANWLDTGGLECGGFSVRWQAFTQQPTFGIELADQDWKTYISQPASGDGLVREVQRVKIADLDRSLPWDTPRLSPAARALELAARAKAYERRFA